MTLYHEDDYATIYHGDCRDVLRALPDQSVNCCVTSPPYFGLRDYGVDGQIGLEPTPDEYVAQMVDVFREVKRVLRNDGTVWLNLGDSYAAGGSGGCSLKSTLNGGRGVGDGEKLRQMTQNARVVPPNLKPKDLIGIPWRVAFALQADGWWLRQDIIWSKPNPMPESVTDRCTKSHEYIFLLSKKAKYYYDAEAIMEPAKDPEDDARRINAQQWDNKSAPDDKKQGLRPRGKGGKNAFRGQGHFRDGENGPANREGRDMHDIGTSGMRNRRSVWTVSTKPYGDAHFATFPPDLIEPCILAGCPEGGTVLDPFLGSGTTARVANQLKRKVVGIELNAEYLELIKKRTSNNQIRLIA